MNKTVIMGTKAGYAALNLYQTRRIVTKSVTCLWWWASCHGRGGKILEAIGLVKNAASVLGFGAEELVWEATISS